MRILVAIVVSGLGAVALACSSIPDVQFLDLDDAGTGGGAKDSAADATDATASPDARASYACPDDPPPAEQGLCCGARLCLGCGQGHCQKCERESCAQGQECCGSKVGNAVECLTPAACLAR